MLRVSAKKCTTWTSLESARITIAAMIAQHSTAQHGTARPAWHSTAQHQGRSTENRNAANLGALIEKAKHFTCICIGAAMKHNWYQ
jgi:hypothetical protein